MPKAAAAVPARFTGFAREAPRFFHELAVEMNREWFAEHKAEYEAQWVAPMTALLGEVVAAIRPTYQGFAVSAPRLFRIHRDVRFGADKTPYKTHIAGVISVGTAKATETAAALYMSLGLEEYAGAGHYVFAGDQLARWRKLVIADRTGNEIAKLVAAARGRGLTLDAHEVLSRTPKGLDPDHPRAELLRHKGLIFGFPAIPRGLIHKPGLAGWLAARAIETAPIVKWLAKRI